MAKNSLQKKENFDLVFKKGQKKVFSELVFYYLPSKKTRQGIIIKKRVGNAVKRNKWKRRLRSLHQNYSNKLKNYDIIVITRYNIDSFSFSTVKKTFETFTSKLQSHDLSTHQMH